MSLSAARIYDESQQPANVIRDLPSDYYDTEVSSIEITHVHNNHYFVWFGIHFFLTFSKFQANRFLEQVVHTKVGFTGLRFFYFTRPLILSVVGTIITYELVLIQFRVITPKTTENMCKFVNGSK